MNLKLAAIGLLLATTIAAYAETAPCGGTNCQPIGWFTSHQVCDECNGGDGTFVPPPPPPPPPGYGSGGRGGAAPAGGVPPPPLTERRGG
jgi:hypothetical protein